VTREGVSLPNKKQSTLYVLLNAAVDRARRDRVAFIDVADEIAVIKAGLPAGTKFDEAEARTELARLAAASRIPVRMD
jgi:hypothetical protein